jgi:steroid delta-isomerase-like uncharacterized protein
MSAQPITSRTEVLAVAAEWDAAWAARDVDRLAAVYTDDAVWEDPSLIAPVQGRAALRAFFAGILDAMPDAVVRQERLFTTDSTDECASQWRVTGTVAKQLPNTALAPTGDRVDYTGMAVITMRDGKVSHLRQYPDVVDVQRQVGALPPAGSRTEKMGLMLQRMSARRRMRRNSRVIHLP